MDQARRLAAPFAVGAVSRLTGLSPHVLRAWERRHGAIRPQRTPGGSRRYSEADVARLRLLGAAVSIGHPIGALAPLANDAIAALLDTHAETMEGPFEEVIAAIARLDAREVERLLGFQVFARGPRNFARDFALPLLVEIGDRWESGRLSVAAEHMASFAVANLLGGALRAAPVVHDRRPILFTTPDGERHEFGVLVAALVASAAGSEALYLGADLPAGEVARAATQRSAAGIALGVTVLAARESTAYLRTLRQQLDRNTHVWIGGQACAGIDRLPDGVCFVETIDAFEALVRDHPGAAAAAD